MIRSVVGCAVLVGVAVAGWIYYAGGLTFQTSKPFKPHNRGEMAFHACIIENHNDQAVSVLTSIFRNEAPPSDTSRNDRELCRQRFGVKGPLDPDGRCLAKVNVSQGTGLTRIHIGSQSPEYASKDWFVLFDNLMTCIVENNIDRLCDKDIKEDIKAELFYFMRERNAALQKNTKSKKEYTDKRDKFPSGSEENKQYNYQVRQNDEMIRMLSALPPGVARTVKKWVGDGSLSRADYTAMWGTTPGNQELAAIFQNAKPTSPTCKA